MQQPSEKEVELAKSIRSNLVQMASQLKPGQVVSSGSMNKMLGVQPQMASTLQVENDSNTVPASLMQVTGQSSFM